MYTSFTDWDHLEHHGIRGMHWGQRRFQNEDGSLTPAGRERYGIGDGNTRVKKRYQKTDGSLTAKGVKKVAQSGTYLEPDVKRAAKIFGRISDNEKQKVRQEFDQKYWDRHDDMYESTHTLSKEYRKLYNSFKDKYAKATLKDLGFIDTPKSRKQVKAILKDISDEWSKKDPSWSDSEKAKKRRDELMHPAREKFRRKAKGVKSSADVISSVKKVIF